MLDLLVNSLRMRPDRIIIGEVRSHEAFDLLQAMNTGHEGTMSSVHANSAADCLARLETLVLLSNEGLPLPAIKSQISSAVDIVIQLQKDRDGIRYISEIVEITGMEAGNLLLQTIGSYDHDQKKLVKTRLASRNIKKLNESSGLPMDFFNLED